jgi:hypothetical protein
MINGYALDTIPLPDDNPYGAWMRTSCLGFFDDGRCAVGTYTGDIWIVSGIDRELKHVTWQRFASGLYEPFGILVIDGLVHVTCRDGIKRLHDLNGDGHADYYETFFADPDVSSPSSTPSASTSSATARATSTTPSPANTPRSRRPARWCRSRRTAAASNTSPPASAPRTAWA